ncbi:MULTISPECIES: hypothetical protein [Burkholderia]|uniref:hypothetical protein n=1 Tax=Burkholderia TaxID=32008 RepID=UPI001269DED0|nr:MULTISPECIES: hypothetical protein [Burkholderia]
MSDGIIHNINNAGNITGTGQFQSTQVVTSYDKSNGNLDMTGTATILGNANISGGVGAGGSITATGEIYSSTSLQTTNGYLNAGDNIYGNGYLAVTRKVQGSYMKPTGGASAGGGRAPDAAIGNDGAQDLFCKSGAWTTGGSGGGQYVLRKYWPGGALVPADQVMCQANPETGGCSCPGGTTDVEYMTGQSDAYSAWDSFFETHFCAS